MFDFLSFCSSTGPDAVVKDEVGGADIDVEESKIKPSKTASTNPGSSIVLSPRY